MSSLVVFHLFRALEWNAISLCLAVKQKPSETKLDDFRFNGFERIFSLIFFRVLLLYGRLLRNHSLRIFVDRLWDPLLNLLLYTREAPRRLGLHRFCILTII